MTLIGKILKFFKGNNTPNDIADVLQQTWDNMSPEEQATHRKSINASTGLSTSMKNIPNIF